MMSKPTILLVDDDPDFLNSTLAALNALGRFKILTANNSDETFRLLREKAIDVLVIDYLLGQNSHYNGDGIIRVVRSEENKGVRRSFLPCILITGSEGEEEMKPELMNLGAKYIKKSKRMADNLVTMIDNCLKEKRLIGAEPLTHRNDVITHVTPWKTGSFYIVAAVVFFVVIGAISRIVPVWIFPIVLVSVILLVVIVGGLQLKHDEKLKDESFLKLMLESVKRLFLLSRKSNDGQ
jgi:CheY-like chemotaxis protein